MAWDETRLWAEALGARSGPYGTPGARERLAVAYVQLRERAGDLAKEIRRDFPFLTIHDVTHFDALWEYADLVAGADISLNPSEAFVFGGAILLHDLGLGVAAYPGGSGELEESPGFADAIALALASNLGRMATTAEIAGASPEIRERAATYVLREQHAARAELLATASWQSETGTELFLISDDEIRANFASIIGRIAHSHWWPTSSLASQFSHSLGPPHWCAQEWDVDGLKLACLLRAADASHLDARRAPRLLRAAVRPQGESAEHWTFQGKLHRPQLRLDRLLFTAGEPFTRDEAAAWWRAWELLRLVDQELREVDSMLVDLNRARLQARGVVAVESPERLADLLTTDGWTPVDARIHVSDLPDLIKKLGGDQLYGNDASIPLRELIQNGSDAVRARRQLESRDSTWGRVDVVCSAEGQSPQWVEVLDTGVGMSKRMLARSLLDFGTSFWTSDDAPREHPGLLGSGFAPTGRFGIGFFSVFMWGTRVRVVSRAYTAAQSDTWALEFTSGPRSTPIVERAAPDELLPDGGTRVRVWLAEESTLGRLRANPYIGEDFTFPQRVAWLAPTSEVTIRVGSAENTHLEDVVEAGDWRQMPPIELVRRIRQPGRGEITTRMDARDDAARQYVDSLVGNMRDLATDGTIVARAYITPRTPGSFGPDPGVVTVGGLRASTLSNIVGVFEGDALTAARDAAIPIVEPDILAEWATEQGRLLAQGDVSPESLSDAASLVWAFGGDTGELPVAFSILGWHTKSELEAMQFPDEVFLVQDASMYLETRSNGSFQLGDNVLACEVGYPGILQTGHGHWTAAHDWPTDRYERGALDSLVMAAVATAWGVDIQAVREHRLESTDDADVIRQIGTRDGNPIMNNVDVLLRPT